MYKISKEIYRISKEPYRISKEIYRISKDKYRMSKERCMLLYSCFTYYRMFADAPDAHDPGQVQRVNRQGRLLHMR